MAINTAAARHKLRRLRHRHKYKKGYEKGKLTGIEDLDKQFYDKGVEDGQAGADSDFGFDEALVQTGEIEEVMGIDEADLDDADIDDADEDEADIDDADDDDATE